MTHFFARLKRPVSFMLALIMVFTFVMPPMLVHAAEDSHILYISNRSNSWDGVDILRTDMELGDVLTITGRTGGFVPPGTQMVLGGAESPWNWANNTEVNTPNQSFVLQIVLGDNHMEEDQFVRFRVQTNGEGSSMSFFIDDIVLTRDGDTVYTLSEDVYVQSNLLNATTFEGHALLQASGSPAIVIESSDTIGLVTLPTIEAPENLEPLVNIFFIDFAEDTFKLYLQPGAQMEGFIVDYHGVDDNYAMRLENVTGNYYSGQGNYLQFNLPQSIPLGSTVEVSWYVYVPSEENLGDRTIVGPGININGVFGSAAHQPTNTQPAPGDLGREIPMDTWVNTTVEFTLGPDIGDMEYILFRFRVNNDTQQPSVLYIDNIFISSRGVAEVFIPEWDLSLPSLAEVFADYFMVGNIWSSNIQMNIGNTNDFFLHHFNAVTAENHHKPDFIAGAGTDPTDPSTWNFSTQDAIVDWAEENNLAMIGHTLIWHSQSPAWLTNISGTTDVLTRAEAMENMHMYIRTVAGRYAGRMQAWDVLNEAISSSVGEFSGDWRNHIRLEVADHQPRWYEAFANGADTAAGEAGYDFIFYAFYFARQYDPYATLFYNDYNEEQPGKREAIAQMVEYMNDRWRNHPSYDGRLLIEGIGLQSHHHLDQWATNFDNIRPAIERFAQTGAVLAITELDITIGTQGNPSIPLLPEQEARQAEYFARVFEYFVEFSDYIERVTFWGKADTQSWRAWGSPLIFNGDFEAKDAFHAILATVERPALESVHIRMYFDTNEGFADLARGVDLSAYMDVPAQVISGVVYIPLRAFTMALDIAEPDWNADTGEVTIWFDGHGIVFVPHIINGRAMIFMEVIPNIFGGTVELLDDGLEIVIG
ncbi:MAG: endo-1,4-beta-xylanase [Defluviitaleaceae bacterium]|nr:endo-1,4-beta-xylanase [Defluviitaleaceae bacterium]